MDPMVYEKVWSATWVDTNNRQGFRFTRTLWYGFGKNKGVRKALRNAPRILATALIGKLAGLVGAQVVAGAASLIEEAVKEVAAKVAEKGSDIALDAAKEVVSQHRNPPPPEAAEGLMRNVKKEVKELKSHAIQVIDRNLVKLNDARNKVKPAFQALIDAQPRLNGVRVAIDIDLDKPNATEDGILAKAQGAMRAVAETQYYIRKVSLQVKAAQWTLERIRTELVNLNAMADQSSSDLAEYIQDWM